MNEQIVAVEQVTSGKLQHISLAEMDALSEFREALFSKLEKGKIGEQCDYGLLPGTKTMYATKEAVQVIADSFLLGYGDPRIEKETVVIDVNGQLITHFIVTAKTPIVDMTSGQIRAVGVGSCSTMESKYRFRGSERTCPKCGKEAIIKGLEKYGGGWLCYKKKGGCGAKFTDNDTSITDQIVGKIENTNPIDVLDTVISMAVKRSKSRDTLGITGMSKFFKIPAEEQDQGEEYH